MATTVYPHIAFAEDGTPYVEGSRIKVEFVAAVYTTASASAEAIAEDYPPLTPGEVHSALAYYFDHKDEIDRQIAEGERVAAELQATYDSSPRLRERLRTRGLLL